MGYKYPSLRTTLPVAGYCAAKDAGVAASDQFTADGTQDGTLTNGATRSGSPLAYSLDGVNDYIDCGDSNSLTFTGAMSVAFWLNPAALPPASSGNRMWIVAKGNASNFEFEFSINAFSSAYGKAVFIRYDLSASAVRGRASSTSISTSTWTHVCFTASSYTALPDCYINGALDNGVTFSVGTPTGGNGTAAMQIGRRATGGENTFNGLIDDLIFWPVQLSASDAVYLASQRGAIYALASAGGGPINSQSLIRPVGDYRPQQLIVS